MHRGSPRFSCVLYETARPSPTVLALGVELGRVSPSSDWELASQAPGTALQSPALRLWGSPWPLRNSSLVCKWGITVPASCVIVSR